MLSRSPPRHPVARGCSFLGCGKFLTIQILVIWGEMKDSGTDGPTFRPFCDIYVLMAAAKDLDLVLSKGDTLKEMDYIQKAGINHPAEAVAIYSLTIQPKDLLGPPWHVH
jgi:hypothetical protein